MKKLILLALILTLGLSATDEVVFDYYGLEGISGNRKLKTFELNYQGAMFTSLFRYQGAYFGYFGVGVADVTIPSIDDETSDLKSHSSLMGDLEFVKPSKWLFISGGARYFNIKGDIHRNGMDYLQENNYSLIEFPLGAGIHYTYKFITGMVGVQKSFYYGQNDLNKYATDTGGRVIINHEKITFSDVNAMYYYLNLSFTILDNYYLGARGAFNGSDDYSLSLTLGTSLKLRK